MKLKSTKSADVMMACLKPSNISWQSHCLEIPINYVKVSQRLATSKEKITTTGLQVTIEVL